MTARPGRPPRVPARPRQASDPLPRTDRVWQLEHVIAARYQLNDGDPMAGAGTRIASGLAELFARVVMLEERLASAEGTVTRCGFCGAPMRGGDLPSTLCRYCGSENAR